VVGDPVDLLVQLDQAVPECGDLDEPRVDGLVDDRRVGPPAVRVVVLVAVVADDRPPVLERLYDLRVGVEDVLALPVGNLGGEPSGVVDGNDQLDAVGLTDPLVLLAEAGGEVDDPGALLGVDVVADEDAEAVRVVGEVREDRLVATLGR
jgi:hypothetical protein